MPPDPSHEAQLRAEREAERIFEMSPALLAVAGFDGYLRRYNPAFEVFGYSHEELLAKPWIEFAHPDDRERMQQAAESLAEGDPVVRIENRVVCRDGSVRWVEWSTRVVPEEGLFYAAGRDVTDTRRAGEEQAALRRVAVRVARETSPEVTLEAVAREVGELLGSDAAHLGRYDPDGSVVSVAQWGSYSIPVGARYPLGGDNVSTRVARTGRPARIDGYDGSGVIEAAVRKLGIRFSIGVPISVQGRLWGVMIVSSDKANPFPPEVESRLEDFTGLVATAISNATAHADLHALALEQAALRRVATMVAQNAPREELFASVVKEVGDLLGVDAVGLGGYQDGETLYRVAMWAAQGEHPPVPDRIPIEPGSLAWEVVRTNQPARKDDWTGIDNLTARLVRDQIGARSSVAAPIRVGDEVWGMIAVHSTTQLLPPDTEERLQRFSALLASALANAEARAEVTRLAKEQGALRRVATLVAQGPAPGAVFNAVAREVAALLDASVVALGRHDGDVLTVVADSGGSREQIVGRSFPLDGQSVTATVLRTGQPARMDDLSKVTGAIGAVARRNEAASSVGAPIVVDGRTWGVLVASWTRGLPRSADVEERLARFAELIGTAIANADSRDQLTASRARLLAAGDEARRRVVRDLHDGAQQRLVHTIITLKLAQRALREDPASALARVDEALATAERATSELRELTHGILPSLLTTRGLRAAVEAFVTRVDLPVEVDAAIDRLPPEIEASAYFIVAEALTNVVKHSRATRASVRAAIEDDALLVEVRDDGVGGADPEGHGLLGMADRVDALGGDLRVESPGDRGTAVLARLPVPVPAG